jgi:hypothetical protein
MKSSVNKRAYDAPRIEKILLDNEISLALQSIPGDPEGWGAKLEQTTSHPFKENLA